VKGESIVEYKRDRRKERVWENVRGKSEGEGIEKG
jgi:hypothetical protein